MKKFLRNWKVFLMSFFVAAAAIGIFHHSGIVRKVSANNTPQALPFSQNWSNTGLITTDDNWSGVPGIVGYRGDDISTTIDVDLRTVTANGDGTPVDVNANRSDPDVFTTGGLAEFDGIANPVVAFQGSGTADIPHIVIYLNTTGLGNINVQYNARDIDAGTGIDAVQQVNTQYRVGGTGDYANVTGGYIADATSGVATATLVTPVNVTLPAAANNQSLVEVRIMTTNALGSDEFVGIDDISITGSPVVATDAPVDFNGDSKTDYAVTRHIVLQRRWFYNTNGTGAPTVAVDWGLTGDENVPEDYDGDGKDDIAVWRPTDVGGSKFFILRSTDSTAQIELFGVSGDNPTVVGDYDGDNKADVAVYRPGASAGNPSTWFYRGTLSNPSGNITFVPWGINGDFVAPGDYDGDGKYDFNVQRGGGAQAIFWLRTATGNISATAFGSPTDIVVPGDYDGDSKTDLAVVRGSGGAINWFIQPSSGGAYQQFIFGATATDFPTQGDYDGDGKCDISIWRTDGTFWVRSSINGAASNFTLGASGDDPVANYNAH
jgi:hypothetical protein